MIWLEEIHYFLFFFFSKLNELCFNNIKLRLKLRLEAGLCNQNIGLYRTRIPISQYRSVIKCSHLHLLKLKKSLINLSRESHGSAESHGPAK